MKLLQMDRRSGKEDDNPYRLLNLIPNERECFVRTEQGVVKRISSHGCSDDKKLELRLGLPGDEEDENFWSKEKKGLKMGNYFPAPAPAPAPRGYAEESSSSHLCCTTMVDLQQARTPPPPPATTDMKNKTFSPPSANPAVPNISQKRAAPAPVVGWPPIRSFRKNLASSSAAKPVQDPQTNKSFEKKPTEKCQKGFFVKINMDGVPIGRKVDLSAYDSYAKLSSAVDLLFRGLLAAQRVHCAGLTEKKQEETAITGLLDGSGEYTLMYEDTEGDRMLAGDVPWHMFVSTVKRLRVLKSSEVSTLSRARGKGRMISNE